MKANRTPNESLILKTGLGLRWIVLSMLILFLVWPGSTARSQSFFAAEIQGGPSYANVYGTASPGVCFEPIVGGYAGINVTYGFSKHFAVKAGLAYERKGTDFLSTRSDIPMTAYVNYTFHYDYLTMPLLVKASFGRSLRFFASAGPSISYLLKQSYISNENLYQKNYWEPDPSTFTENNHLDIGLICGIGVEYAISKSFITSLECRTNIGLTNTNLFPVFVSPIGETTGTNRTLKNFSAMLVLGFSYTFGSQK